MITHTPERVSLKNGMKRNPHICICVSTEDDWGRDVIRGIYNFAVKKGPWHLSIQPVHSRPEPDCDGAIGFFDRDNSNSIANSGFAMINLWVTAQNYDIPTVTSNHHQAAKYAVEHFQKHCLKRFGYVGPLTQNIVANHAGAFEEHLRELNHACQVFDSSNLCDPHAAIHWLESLPKPIGILTWNAATAAKLVSMCHRAGINVPDQIAVLSGQEDELICSTCSPSLSSIQTAPVQIGYEAARQLDAQLSGAKPVASVQEIDPVMVVERDSTATFAIDDPELLAAVRFIRNNACLGISVQKVSEAISIGRRSLERKFKENFGCTPLDEIQRLRMARVRELLIQTDLPIAKIAKDAGFGTPEYMTTMFKSRFGQTPLKFRSNSRAR